MNNYGATDSQAMKIQKSLQDKFSKNFDKLDKVYTKMKFENRPPEKKWWECFKDFLK